MSVRLPPRPLLALMAANFLMWGGFFMIIPLTTVHFVTRLGWAAAGVGLVLGARQLTQQGLTVFGGALSDRLGPRGLILAGCLVRALGFAAMGQATTLPTLLAAALLAGVGGSLFDAPKNAAVTALTLPEARTRAFALMGVAGNLGMVTGPLIGALLAGLPYSSVALYSASAYLIAGALLAATLPAMRPKPGEARPGLEGLRIAATDRRFAVFTLLLAGYFLLSSQLNVAVTLKAVGLYGVGATGPLYGLNAGLAVLLQLPLIRLAGRYLPQRHVLVLGVLLTAVALGCIALANTFAALLACVALFSLGTMLVFPTQQALTARLARPGLYGSYFGFGALSLGVGGALGNVLGGTLSDLGVRLAVPALPWLTLMSVGLLAAAGLWLELRRVPEEGASLAGDAPSSQRS